MNRLSPFTREVCWTTIRTNTCESEPNASSASKPWRVSQFSEGYAILIDERNGRKNRESYIVIDTEGNEVGTINPAAPLLAKVRGSGVHDGLIVVDFIDTEGTGQGGGGAAVDIHGNIVVPYGSVTGDFDMELRWERRECRLSIPKATPLSRVMQNSLYRLIKKRWPLFWQTLS